MKTNLTNLAEVARHERLHATHLEKGFKEMATRERQGIDGPAWGYSSEKALTELAATAKLIRVLRGEAEALRKAARATLPPVSEADVDAIRARFREEAGR